MSKQILLYVTPATSLTYRIWVYASPDSKISSVLYEALKVVECASVWGGADKRSVTESLLTTMVSLEVDPSTSRGILQVLSAYLRKQLPTVEFSYYEDINTKDLTQDGRLDLSAMRSMTQLASSEELLRVIHTIEAQAQMENEQYRNEVTA